jgi:hypothetical protein
MAGSPFDTDLSVVAAGLTLVPMLGSLPVGDAWRVAMLYWGIAEKPD